ncbi:hypothetical protein ABNG03_03255 [Halorubrum sp. RMP-47]|uniref:DUF1102 domain-containing protein n=1 Tax=Halorubrum miltondacostae TaxID=3076378 RepID=A0ABD5M147_9EURY
MASRRSVLIGLGSLVAGGGALLGTGAFTTVTAERTVSIETTGDASGFLGLEAADRVDDSGTNQPANGTTGANQNEYVQETDGTIQINLDAGSDGDADDNGTGLNQNAKTTFRNLVTITNNGTQTVTSLTLSISENSGTITGSPFSFTVDDNSNETTVSNGNNILGAGSPSITSDLTPGESIDFGMIINLIGNSIPDSANYTLTITAETNQSN